MTVGRLLAVAAAAAAVLGAGSVLVTAGGGFGSAAAATGEGCALPPLAATEARTASQLITVVAARASSTSGTMRLWERSGGCWRSAGGPWRAELGYAGVSEHHLEGDGTTPAGVFSIGPVMYGVAPNPGVRYRYHRLVCGDWWDEDPSSSDYNRFEHVPCGTSPPFGGGSEPLWRSPRAYAHFALIDYNVAPAIPGRGSAIFIHASIGGPTDGCVSLPLPRLVRLLRWLDPADRPLIAVGVGGADAHGSGA